MKKSLMFICLVMALWAIAPVAQAQNRGDRSQWMNEIRQYKRSYMAKELGLTKEQEQKFFPVYEEMDAATSEIEQETRAMEKRLNEAADVTDLEYQKGAEALFDMGSKQAEVEKSYMEKFRSILTARQLFLLKGVERQFSRDLMRQHQRLRQNRKQQGQ